MFNHVGVHTAKYRCESPHCFESRRSKTTVCEGIWRGARGFDCDAASVVDGFGNHLHVHNPFV